MKTFQLWLFGGGGSDGFGEIFRRIGGRDSWSSDCLMESRYGLVDGPLQQNLLPLRESMGGD